MKDEVDIRAHDKVIDLRKSMEKAGLIFFFGFFFKWYIKLCGLFNAKAILVEEK